MQQTITDRILNHKCLAIAGISILLLIIFSNNSKSFGFPTDNNSDELVCEFQGDANTSALFIEDVNEYGYDNEFSGFSIKSVFPEDADLSNQILLNPESANLNFQKKYFQNDLSPPFYI